MLVTALLTLKFLWNLLVAGGERPLSPVHYMTMGIELAMLIGLVGLRSQIAGVLSADDGRHNTMRILFVVGVIAGVGLLAIRFTSDAAWTTGHLRNYTKGPEV